MLNIDRLSFDEKIKKSKRVLEEAYDKFGTRGVIVAWTGGKDSTLILYLIKETFGRIPFRVMFNDSTMEFPEVYTFIKKITKELNLDLLWVKHLPKDLEAYEKTLDPTTKMKIMRLAKINVINYIVKKYKIKAFVSGIRWDEHKSRSKEKYFSPRQDHMRIHPILHFTEKDVWTYIKKFEVPYNPLYDKNYRSLGERGFTKPVKDPHAPERAGRERDKEKIMESLRKLGYW